MTSETVPATPSQRAFSVVAEELFLQQRRVDPFGHRLHAWLAAVWCFLACSPTSFLELGILPVGICFLIRLPRHIRTDGRLLHLPTIWFALAWIAWIWASLSWSSNASIGIEEAGAARFAFALVLLWPVLDRRTLLIKALLLGFLAANVAQAFHAIGTAFNIESITFPRMPHRNSGWWQPVVGGTMLTAGLGLHLPAMLTGKGRVRVIGFLGVLLCIVGVIATGSRGAWLASASLCVIALVWGLTRRGWPRVSWGHLPLIGALGVVLAVGGYKTLWPTLSERGRAGIVEVRRAITDKDYTSDTGARILMAQMAIDALVQKPLNGIGAGSFKGWGRGHLADLGREKEARLIPDHAHNTFLHVAATTGVVGVVLFGGLIILSVRGGFWTPRASADETDARAKIAGYEAGPVFGLIGLVLASPFIVIQVDAQPSAMLWILIVLCLRGRPAEVSAPS
ncbi:MAG: O-antigen ligase family protein [Pyrinomonadaceae bacterium]|nr:O-antigen ligase family protein [Phycisphaerales bacterium]